jgi:signal transduction histidine kinase
MSRGSLRLRLLVAAAISITMALVLAGMALVSIFEGQVRDRVQQELNNHLLQLVAALSVGRDGTVSVKSALADPRFDQPLSGMYWEVRPLDGGEPLTSRSLWDVTLGKSSAATVTGPEGEPLIASTRTIRLEANGKEAAFELTVATHLSELSLPVESFSRQIVYYLGLIGLALLIAAWVQVSVGLSPLRALSDRLKDVAQGRRKRLEGEFPDEVAPLVGELNELLDAQEASVERARARAGDLAHGLKTPLSVLAAVARDVAGRGLKQEASEIEVQAETMRRHVERQLARARLATGHGVTAVSFREQAERVIAAMKRAPRGNSITWRLDAAPPDAVAVERQDLTELLGNLLDNARKWAKSTVAIRYANGVLSIEDDGAGVPESELSQIAKRGVRLDEDTQGSGLGLAIVQDIVEVYGADLRFGQARLGGLAVTIRFKA